MTIYYLNQGYLSYKDNKKIYYIDLDIVGPIVPLLSQSENLDEYKLKENEVKIIRANYDTVTGQFIGLENFLGYLNVRGDMHEISFDYGFSKEKSKDLYNMHRMKIPNSFSSTIFNRHRIQYDFGAYSETDFSEVFFFLPCTVDRVEEINQYLGSVNLSAIDIDISDFCKNFNPSKLDYANPE